MWRSRLLDRFMKFTRPCEKLVAQGVSRLSAYRCARYLSSTDHVVPVVNDDSHSEPTKAANLLEPEVSKVPAKVLQPCPGCGVPLQTQDPDRPGYLPEHDMKVCQRCFRLTHYNDALHQTVSTQDYVRMLSELKTKRALILLMVDVLDFPSSLFPDLFQLLSHRSVVVIVGNKADLLSDAKKGELWTKYSEFILSEAKRFSLQGCKIKGIHFISAKTGQGIDKLIDYIMKDWGNRGDIYLLGCTNVGKSSLFNQLMKIICGSNKLDHTSPATISRWPGTTLDLLKFPLMSVRKWFRLAAQKERAAKLGFEPEHGRGGYIPPANRYWVHDTPGAVNDNQSAVYTLPVQRLSPLQLINLLTSEELRRLLPSKLIKPRSFILKPGQTLFLGGLYRLDYVNGATSVYFTVFASHQLPMHTTRTLKAKELYKRHAGEHLLGIPSGGPERMADFPALVPTSHNITGVGWKKSASDLIFSGVGWVAVTAGTGMKVDLETHAPVGIEVCLRTPALIPEAINQRGRRLRSNDKTKYLG